MKRAEKEAAMKISVDAKPSKKMIVKVRKANAHRVAFGCLFIRSKDLAKFKAVRG